MRITKQRKLILGIIALITVGTPLLYKHMAVSDELTSTVLQAINALGSLITGAWLGASLSKKDQPKIE